MRIHALCLWKNVRNQDLWLHACKVEQMVQYCSVVNDLIKASGEPHTTVSSWNESCEQPDEVVVEKDEHGNVIT